MNTNYLSKEGIKAIEKGFELKIEAFALLELINAEFQSDPLSVQCFDSRIVKRVKNFISEKKMLADF